MSFYIGLTAIKDLHLAKSRLNSPILSAEKRQILVLAMLADTVSALSTIIDHWFITTRDPHVRSAAQKLDMTVIDECSPYPHNTTAAHNFALHSANIAALDAFPHAQRLFIQPDLPAISPQEVNQLALLLSQYSASFISDKSEVGTTVVYLAAPEMPFPGLFGPQSAKRHREHGLVDISHNFSGLREDIDTFDDLQQMLATHHYSTIGSASTRVLQDLMIL